MPTDEYYSSTAWRYGSLWLGGLRVWHSKDDYPYSASGSAAFLKLLVSRDGLHWKKVPFKNDAGDPEVFIPNGPEGGNDAHNDGGYMTEFSNAPLRIGDELVYYYGSSSWGKNQPRDYRVSGGGIFRARLRPDGFVSVDGGSLVTRRLKFEGQEITVNGVGPITVEVVTAAENTVTSVAQATIRGDSLRHQVVFDQNRSLRDVAPDGIVQLRFTVGNGGGALFVHDCGPRWVRRAIDSRTRGYPANLRLVGTGNEAGLGVIGRPIAARMPRGAISRNSTFGYCTCHLKRGKLIAAPALVDRGLEAQANRSHEPSGGTTMNRFQRVQQILDESIGGPTERVGVRGRFLA